MTRRVPPTRVELLRGRRLLVRLDKGVGLLRRKREALVRELFPLARPAAEARRSIAARALDAYAALIDAGAIHGTGEIDATGWPTRVLELDIDLHRVWGIAVPHLSDLPEWRRGLLARGTAPGPTGPALFDATNRFEELAEELLAAAPREVLLRALGQALARTSRQLHTLEHVVIPALRARVAAVAAALDEREREEHTRLRHIRGRRRTAAISG